MERRVLLAITLSFLVLFLFQRFVMPPPRPANAVNQSAQAPAATPAPGTSGTQGASGTQAPLAPGTQGTSGTLASQGTEISSSTMTVGDVNAKEIVVETSKVRAVFSNRGATILHWTLK